MSPANPSRAALSLRHLFAGLQAGITGAFAMLLFSMAGSILSRRSVWLVPNLFATTFYGEGAYRNGFGRFTWSGFALFFVVYALLGMLWGALMRDRKRSLQTFWGALYGLVCFYAMFHFAWKRWNPLIPLYFPDSNLRLGHLVGGVFRCPGRRFIPNASAGRVETDPFQRTLISKREN